MSERKVNPDGSDIHSDPEYVEHQLRNDAKDIKAIERRLGVSRDVAALYNILWNIEIKLGLIAGGDSCESREPWEEEE